MEKIWKMEREMKVFEIKLMCSCGGEMKPLPFYQHRVPNQYPHRCQKCNAKKTIRGEKYPRIKYEYLQNFQEA